MRVLKRSLHSPTFPIGLCSESDGLFRLHWDATGTGPSANCCQIVSPSPSPIQVESKWNLLRLMGLGLHSDSTQTGSPANSCQLISPSPSPIPVESEWTVTY